MYNLEQSPFHLPSLPPYTPFLLLIINTGAVPLDPGMLRACEKGMSYSAWLKEQQQVLTLSQHIVNVLQIAVGNTVLLNPLMNCYKCFIYTGPCNGLRSGPLRGCGGQGFPLACRLLICIWLP